MTALPGGAEQLASARHRRPRRPFARADRIALLLGVSLAMTMFGWVSVRATQNLMADRSVGEGRPATEMERH